LIYRVLLLIKVNRIAESIAKIGKKGAAEGRSRDNRQAANRSRLGTGSRTHLLSDRPTSLGRHYDRKRLGGKRR